MKTEIFPLLNKGFSTVIDLNYSTQPFPYYELYNVIQMVEIAILLGLHLYIMVMIRVTLMSFCNTGTTVKSVQLVEFLCNAGTASKPVQLAEFHCNAGTIFTSGQLLEYGLCNTGKDSNPLQLVESLCNTGKMFRFVQLVESTDVLADVRGALVTLSHMPIFRAFQTSIFKIQICYHFLTPWRSKRTIGRMFIRAEIDHLGDPLQPVKFEIFYW